MRWDRLTIKSQEALQEATSAAEQKGNPEVSTLHLLDALLAQQEGVATSLLSKLGADPALVSSQVQERLARLPKVTGQAGFQPSMGQDLARALDDAYKLTSQFKDE